MRRQLSGSAIKEKSQKKGGSFFQQVYEMVARIPKGKVMTYGQIAACLGGYYSGRTVGFAMRAAPEERNLPCYRVVNKQGDMAPGYCFGGAEQQRRLLKSEGVKFKTDGKINLAKSQLDYIGTDIE